MKSVSEMLAEMSPERRERILDRAEALIAVERRGRFAPETNQNAAAAGGPYTGANIVLGFILFIAVALPIAVILWGPSQ